MIKPSWAVSCTFAEMPFSDESSLVASMLEMFVHHRYEVVDIMIERHDPIDVTMRSGKNGRSTRGTDRIIYVTVVEKHAFIR